jgi:Spy/CpxP family protein refolding chaperone
MNNLKTWSAIVLTFLLGLSGWAGAGPAWANPRFAARGIFLAKNISKEDMSVLYERLNLTEKQRVQLEENRKRHHESMKALSDQLVFMRQQLNQALEKSVLDKGEIAQIKARMDRLQSELSDLRLKGILDVRAILTPEQYEIFSEILQ